MRVSCDGRPNQPSRAPAGPERARRCMADPSDSGTTTHTTVDPAAPMLSMGPTSEFARRGYTWSGTVLGRGSFGVALLVHRHDKQVDEAGRASLTNITPYVCKTPSLAQLTESDRKMIAREVVTLEYVSKKATRDRAEIAPRDCAARSCRDVARDRAETMRTRGIAEPPDRAEPSALGALPHVLLRGRLPVHHHGLLQHGRPLAADRGAATLAQAYRA